MSLLAEKQDALGTSSWVAESLVQGQGHISFVKVNWKGMETGQKLRFALEQTGVARCWHTEGLARSCCATCSCCFYNSSVHWHKDHGIIDGDFVVIMMAKAKATGVTLLEKQLKGFFRFHLQEAPPPPAAAVVPPAPPVAPAAPASPPVTAWSQELEESLGDQILFGLFFTKRQTFLGKPARFASATCLLQFWSRWFIEQADAAAQATENEPWAKMKGWRCFCYNFKSSWVVICSAGSMGSMSWFFIQGWQ